MPANDGVATLVPPILLSENLYVFPFGCRVVWADQDPGARVGERRHVRDDPHGRAAGRAARHASARLVGTTPAW